ncbi:MAG: 1,4-dihydroxy-6-naphthoate synthase, partial [Mariniphaga sp.]|nr:1,4-dihydroxy-6-naphthoate synthase [Mariniphaga sp.]
GEDWEINTGQAIPLGGIVVNRNLPEKIKNKINRVLKRSIEFAFENPKESCQFVKKHAQKLDDEVINKHISLYVNQFSVSLGEKGRMAINMLFGKAFESGIIKKMPEDIFIK